MPCQGEGGHGMLRAGNRNRSAGICGKGAQTMKGKKWRGPLLLLAAAVLVGLGLWRGLYRGVTPLPLRTAEAKTYAAQVEARGAERVSVRYAYPQQVVIGIRGELMEEVRGEILDLTAEMLRDPAFKLHFSEAHARRCRNAEVFPLLPEGVKALCPRLRPGELPDPGGAGAGGVPLYLSL